MNSVFYQSGMIHEPNMLFLYPFFVKESDLAQFYTPTPKIDLGTTTQFFDELPVFNEKIFKLTTNWVISQPTIELSIKTGNESIPFELEGYTVVAPNKQKPEAMLDSVYTSYAYSNNLEIETILNFKQVAEIAEVYIEETKLSIVISAILSLGKYDYVLMKRIFNTIEFPIKDRFEDDKIITFKYLYTITKDDDNKEYLGKLIFRRYGK